MSLVGLFCAFSALFVVSCQNPSGGGSGKTLDRIEITTPPTKTTYVKGADLDLTGMVVTAYYTDNTNEPVSVTAANVAGYNNNTTGRQTLTVTFGGKTATFTVTVTAAGIDPTKTLDHIEITTPPTKTSYVKGEDLNLAGLVVTAYYTDDTSEPVDAAADAVTGYNKDTLGQQILTITLSGRTATFIVIVTATAQTRTLSSITITTPPTKTSYALGEALDTAGMVVTATYSDGNTAPVTGYTTSGFDSSTPAVSQTITVSYTEGGVTQTAVFIVVITGETGDNAVTLYWVDEQGNLAFSNGGAPVGATAAVSPTGTLTVTMQETGYSGQAWLLNGIEDAARAGQSSYTFSGAGKEAGKKYVIGLRAAKNGKYYYAELVVTVTAQ